MAHKVWNWSDDPERGWTPHCTNTEGLSASLRGIVPPHTSLCATDTAGIGSGKLLSCTLRSVDTELTHSAVRSSGDNAVPNARFVARFVKELV